jgi:tetratricopeptide (TPR) repeat protein
MMTGNIIKVGNTVVLTSRLLDVDDGSVIQSRKVEGIDIYAMVDELTSYVIEDLNLGMVETVDLAVSQKTSSNIPAYNHYVTGVDHLNNAKFVESVLEFQEAVSMDPTFKRALYKLAIAQWWAKDVDITSSDSATIVTLDTYLALPNLTGDEKNLAEGVKNIFSKNYFDALETFEYLSEKHPDNKEYFYLLGECHFHGLNNTLKALNAFERAMYLDPEFELASIHILDLYSLEKRYDKAIEIVESKLDKNPNSLVLLDRLAIIKFNQGFTDDGIKIADKILAIDSTYFGARFKKILMLYELRKFNEAEPMINNFLEEYRGRFDVFFLRNGFYFIQGRYTEIRQKLLDGINETSKNKLNKKESIKIQTYARSILLSNCLSKNIKHLREDVKLFSDISDPDIGVFTDFLYLMAWSHLIIGDSVSFKEFQKRTQELIIEKDLSHTWHNEYLKAFQVDEALFNREWHQAISEYRKFSNNPAGQLFREFFINKKCEAEFQLMKYDHALITAKKMVSPDQDPGTFTFNRPFGYYWQGRIHQEEGNTQEAISAYESLLELWKNGDERLPKRIDAQKRLKSLKKNS